MSVPIIPHTVEDRKNMRSRIIASDEKRLIELILAELGENDISFSESGTVGEIDNEGSIKFVGNHTPSPHEGLPVEAHFIDTDGVPVYAQVFVVGKRVDELEIYKADGSPILRKPRPEDWTILNLSKGQGR